MKKKKSMTAYLCCSRSGKVITLRSEKPTVDALGNVFYESGTIVNHVELDNEEDKTIFDDIIGEGEVKKLIITWEDEQ